MNQGASYYVAAGLVAAAVVMSLPEGSPTPAPLPEGHLSLDGCFTGPDGAADAVTLACLAYELADEIEYDAMCDEPLATGVAFDELRRRARILRCRGESLGEKYPALCERVHKFLTDRLGESGGPVSPEQRARWVAAYREIGRAAEYVVK